MLPCNRVQAVRVMNKSVDVCRCHKADGPLLPKWLAECGVANDRSVCPQDKPSLEWSHAWSRDRHGISQELEPRIFGEYSTFPLLLLNIGFVPDHPSVDSRQQETSVAT